MRKVIILIKSSRWACLSSQAELPSGLLISSSLNLIKQTLQSRDLSVQVTHLNHDPEVVRNGFAVFLPGDGDGQVSAADDAGQHDSVALFALLEAEGINHRGLCVNNQHTGRQVLV